jgi:hypothetical protein
LRAYGTNIEGEWESVMDAIKRCHVQVHEMGAPRINSTVKLEAPKGVTRRAHLPRLLPWMACMPVLHRDKDVTY